MTDTRRVTLSPVARAALAYVRKLRPEEFEALVGNPLRERGDLSLWWYLLGLEAEQLGMLVADAVAEAGGNGIALPLDEHVMAAWQAWDEWGQTLGCGYPVALVALGADTAAGRWDTTARRWGR